jgi:uncharacterized protein (DUF486 family)
MSRKLITLTVFPIFSAFYFGKAFRCNRLVGFALIAVAAFFVFGKW